MGKLKSHWTDEETELLKELWPKTEIELGEIAKVLNRSKQSISAKASRLELPSRETFIHSRINREYLENLYKVING